MIDSDHLFIAGTPYTYFQCFSCKTVMQVFGEFDACPSCGGVISDPNAVKYEVVAISPNTVTITEKEA